MGNVSVMSKCVCDTVMSIASVAVLRQQLQQHRGKSGLLADCLLLQRTLPLHHHGVAARRAGCSPHGRGPPATTETECRQLGRVCGEGGGEGGHGSKGRGGAGGQGSE